MEAETFTAQIYCHKNEIIASRNESCLNQLIVKVITALENLPSGSSGVIRDNRSNKIVGHYKRRSVE